MGPTLFLVHFKNQNSSHADLKICIQLVLTRKHILHFYLNSVRNKAQFVSAHFLMTNDQK